MLSSRVLSARRVAGVTTKLLSAGLLLLLAAAGAAYAAQSAKQGITLGIAPTSQSVTRGQPAGYTVSVTSTSGFAGTVVLSASGLPGATSAAFTPASVRLTANATASSTLTVTTTSSTPVGSTTITVSGASGTVTGRVAVSLTVNYPLSSTLSLTVTPAAVTLAPGSTAVYTVQLTRTNFPGPVTLAVIGGPPSGATATFTPNPTTGNSSTLQVRTTATTKDGTYPLYLVGSGQNPSGHTEYAYASVQFVLSSTDNRFTIGGNLSGLLAPGSTTPLDLVLSNPNQKPLSVTNLTVTVQSVTRTTSAIAHNLACTSTDYTVAQYSGPYPLTVPANGSASLSGLGIRSSARPQVGMRNTSVNQDGCKGATLTFAYNGSGQGN
jgi:uncharacterized membrane protein